MIRITNPRRFLVFVGGLLVVLAVVIFLFTANPPVAKSGALDIAEGTSARAVWQQLVDEGFTARTLPWRYQAWRSNAAANIKAGRYQLEQGEHVHDVIQRFVAGDTAP